MNVLSKQTVVERFLSGESIADLATLASRHPRQVESVIREAMRGLLLLKVPAQVEVTPSAITIIHEPTEGTPV